MSAIRIIDNFQELENVTGDVEIVPSGEDETVFITGPSGTLDVEGHIEGSSLNVDTDINVGARILHLADSNTYISFTTDQIDFYAGGFKLLSLDEVAQDKVEVNPDDRNIDFVVNGDNIAGLIYTDASYDYVSFGGGISVVPKLKEGTYTTTSSDYLIFCNGTFTININAIFNDGQRLLIKNIGAGTITVDGYSTQTIDGALTQALAQWEYIEIVSEKKTGSWYIIGDNR